MQFIITDKETDLDKRTSAAALVTRRPDLAPTIEHIADLRKITDDNAKVTNWGRTAGTAGSIKAYCRVPFAVIWDMMNDPTGEGQKILEDEAAFAKWLVKHKEWHSYTKPTKRK